MLHIKDGFVSFTKGDTVTLGVDLVHPDGQPYVMQTGDKLVMSAKDNLENEVCFLVQSNTKVIEILPEHTKNLPEGLYFYDIELQTAGGGRYTVVGVTGKFPNMRIYPEVTV